MNKPQQYANNKQSFKWKEGKSSIQNPFITNKGILSRIDTTINISHLLMRLKKINKIWKKIVSSRTLSYLLSGFWIMSNTLTHDKL